MMSSRSLDTLTAADFRDLKRSRFQLATALPQSSHYSSLEVELAEISEVGGHRSDAFREPFSLVFHGPIEPILPQGMYLFEHDQLGALTLFIVPIGPVTPSQPGERPAAMRYEVVFG